jgi:hypothetical protein
MKLFYNRHSELDSESIKKAILLIKPKEILNQVQDDVAKVS